MLYFIGEERESNRKKDVHMYVKLSKDWDERNADRREKRVRKNFWP